MSETPRLDEYSSDSTEPLMYPAEAVRLAYENGKRDQLAEDRAWMQHKADCPAKFRISLTPEEVAAGWTTPAKMCECGLTAHLGGGEK